METGATPITVRLTFIKNVDRVLANHVICGFFWLRGCVFAPLDKTLAQ
jgi:hypothetical protein